jgi:hypothetical protein
MIMSDTPPARFFTVHWQAGLILAAALGAALARAAPAAAGSEHAWVSRAIAAFTEAGLFVVLPVTAVWQAATAQGWTTSLPAHAAVGVVAVLTATIVATVAWRPGSTMRYAAITAAVLAAGYAVTGSGIVPLLGALVLEFGRRATTAGNAPDGRAADTASSVSGQQTIQRSPQPETSP